MTTYLGRKRRIPELTVSGFAQRAYGERVAANTPIQGASDVLIDSPDVVGDATHLQVFAAVVEGRDHFWSQLP